MLEHQRCSPHKDSAIHGNRARIAAGQASSPLPVEDEDYVGDGL